MITRKDLDDALAELRRDLEEQHEQALEDLRRDLTDEIEQLKSDLDHIRDHVA